MSAVADVAGGMRPARTEELRAPIAAILHRWARDGSLTVPGLYELGGALVRVGATDAELAHVASELMWRHRGNRLSHDARAPGGVADPSPACRFLYYCLLRHANYLFDLRSCLALASEAHRRWPDDPWFTALLGMAELAQGDTGGDRRLTRLMSWCDEPRVRHLVMTAYVISRQPGAPLRVIELAERMRRDGQDDVVVGFREAVARRRLGDLDGALAAVDRALHELATGPYDRPTRVFVNEQLRQERERVLDRIDRARSPDAPGATARPRAGRSTPRPSRPLWPR